MDEIIIPARMLIEDHGNYVCMTRAGLTCSNQDNELVSCVFDPNESPYTVIVQNSQVGPGMQLMIGHVFVDRYMKWAGLKEMIEIWRWHVDVYKPGLLEPNRYSQVVDTGFQGAHIVRYGFEHVAGREQTRPQELLAQFKAEMVPTAACTRNLVPERGRYRRNAEHLFHPGVFDMQKGILAEFDDLVKQQNRTETLWVM